MSLKIPMKIILDYWIRKFNLIIKGLNAETNFNDYLCLFNNFVKLNNNFVEVFDVPSFIVKKIIKWKNCIKLLQVLMKHKINILIGANSDNLNPIYYAVIQGKKNSEGSIYCCRAPLIISSLYAGTNTDN